MARAPRHFIPGQAWHITLRCHKKEFLLKFVKDRQGCDSDPIGKLVVSKDLNRELKFILYRYGITRASLFPGLDGLSSHLEWLRGEKY